MRVPDGRETPILHERDATGRAASANARRGGEDGGLIRKAWAGTRSGFNRYSKEVIEAFRAASRERVLREPTESRREWGVRESGDDLSALWIGHATMLVRLGDKTILTDPVFSDRIGMSVPMPGFVVPNPVTFGLARLNAPAVDLEHLPKIDVILISHAHFDHLDRPSLLRLAAGPAEGAMVVTARNTAKLIPTRRVSGQSGAFGKVVELDWNNGLELPGLRIEAVKPSHWGARAAVDHHRKWNAYVVRETGGVAGNAGGRSFFFAGDTALTDAFERIGPVDLAMFGIGAYDPWSEAHATPEQAWRMFRGMNARKLAPMHHSTFKLSDEPTAEPLQRLIGAAGSNLEQIVCSGIGDVWSLSPRPVVNEVVVADGAAVGVRVDSGAGKDAGAVTSASPA